MAALIHFTSTFLVYPHKPLTHLHLNRERRAKLLVNIQRFAVRADTVRKPRAGRRAKSNVELCNEIKQFLSSVGLPEDHVPHMKELSLHGRTDLANIVRRRGYKLIRELLAGSVELGVDELNGQKSIMEKPLVASETKETSEGQDEEVDNLAEKIDMSNEVKENSSDGNNLLHEESLQTLSAEEKSSQCEASVIEDMYSVTEDSVRGDDLGDYLTTNVEATFDSSKLVPEDNSENLVLEVEATASLDLAEKLSSTSEDLSPYIDASGEDNCSSNANLSSMSNGDSHNASIEHYTKPNLEEKVAKFMEDGYLDPIEGIFNDFGDEEHGFISAELTESENKIESQPKTSVEVQLDTVHSGGNSSVMFNGHTTSPITSPEKLDHASREIWVADEQRTDADPGNNLDAQINERERLDEISQLKYMLHQKELELSRLKELIEKEKLALSVLQTKAETEISKAEQLITDKDVELKAAEESLSGLIEVQIQYSGEAEIVEVAGSFNGWQYWIKMDPEPLTNSTDTTTSRKSNQWSIMLWLYPGTYEIKFVVDGQWKIDPQKETVTKGTIANNILRVEG